MKKNYVSLLTSCVFAITVNSALAQAPTITSANLPTVGITYTQMNDSTTAELPTFTVSAGSASAQTWNYTSEFVTTYSTAMAFVAPSTLAGASNFPNATLGASSGGNSLFFTAGASGLDIVGAYAAPLGSYIAIPYTPSEVIIPTPFTYNNNQVNAYTSTFTLTAVNGGITYAVKIVQHSTRNITADAFGSLTTPAGTFASTLRIKTYQVDIDTQFVYLGTSASGTPVNVSPSRDSSYTYEWVQNSHPALLMEIDMNGLGTSVTGANYTKSAVLGITSIPTAFEELSLYPNPATTATNLSYENKYATHVTVTMFDITGRLIATLADENQTAGKQALAIDTKVLGLNSGMYFVKVSSPNGTETMKLNIN